jgi:hypothetical protein
MDSLNQLSIKNLLFKKIKDKVGEYRKNYILLNSLGEKIKITLNNVTIPFGIEKYNSTNILNIEISPKKSNDHYNINAIITAFESELSNIELIRDKELKKELEDKGYYQNIRESKDGYIIRCHVLHMPEIFMMIGKFKNLLTMSDVKKTKATVELELSLMWINDNNYGIIWSIKNIEILTSY